MIGISTPHESRDSRRTIAERLFSGKRRFAAMFIAVLAIGAGQIVAGAPAYAADPQSAGIDTLGDGTGHGGPNACSITGAGGDNNDHDGVVCTNDTISYLWSLNIPANQPVTAHFSQTLPEGVTWQDDNVAQCISGPMLPPPDNTPSWTGTAQISNDGRTMTCDITFAAGAARSVALPMIAHVSASAPNGLVVQPPLSITSDSGTQTYTPSPVTVVSKAQVDLIKHNMAVYESGPNVYNGQAGTIIQVAVVGAQTGSTNSKGIAQLASPLTFTDVLDGMPANAVLVTPGNCYIPTSQAGSAAPGTWSCSQAGPGAPVNITITGADTSGSATDSASVAANTHTVFSGAFRLFIPAESVPVTTVGVNQLTNFDPNDIGGNSNFGSGWEPGGQPGDTCSNPVNNNNCNSIALQPPPANGFVTAVKVLQRPNGDSLAGPGLTGTLAPGQAFRAKLSFLGANATQNNLLLCDKWDRTKQVIDPSRPIDNTSISLGAGPMPAHTIEYSTRPLTTAQLSGSGCGTPGDAVTDGPWYSSIAAAGGAEQISAVRMVFSQPVTNMIFDWYVPMINVDPNAGDTSIDVVASSAQDRPFTDHATAQYVVSGNVLGLEKTANGTAATSVTAGSTVEYELQPSFSLPDVPDPEPGVLTVVDQLPICLENPTVVAPTEATWSVSITPADIGPDGLSCTADDVSGAILTFTSNPVQPNTTVPPIRYEATVSRLVPDNTLKTNTAVISADGNGQPESERIASAGVNVRAAFETQIQKYVDQPLVEVSPDQIGFTAQFVNTRTTSVGRSQWIDILPWNGDGRGTDFDGTLRLSSLQVLGTPTNDVTVEYTSRPPAQIAGDPNDASNGAGGSTVWCTEAQFGNAGCPAVIGDTTAIRLTIGNLTGNRTGGIHFTMQPSGNSEGDIYRNYVSPGRAAGLPQPIPTSNTVEVRVVASSIGDYVWFDANNDGVQDPGEPGLAGVTVNLVDPNDPSHIIETTVTDANGLYHFTSLHSSTPEIGDYRVVVDTSTLPYPGQLVPTYDLDDGTDDPDSDSGAFSLGFDQDRDDVDFGYYLVPGDPSAFFTTQASPQLLSPGATVDDNVTFFGSAAGEYTWRLYGPMPQVAGSCDDVDWSTAPLKDSGTFTVPGAGSYTVGSTVLDDLGCYTYQGSLAIAALGGLTVSDTRGLEEETVLVELGVPSISTVAASGDNRPGTTTSDTVTITGLTQPSTYTWTLYGPEAPINGSCDGVTWSEGNSVSGSFPVDPSTTVYTTPERTVDAAGCYTYGGSLAATAGTAAQTQAPGDPLETFLIDANAPLVTTVAQAAGAEPGDSVTDAVHVSGMGSQAGSYDWILYGPMPAINDSCAGIDWSGAMLWDSGNIGFAGDGDYVTSPSILGGPGCYTYAGSLAATATTSAVTLPAGVPDETFLVVAAPPAEPAVVTAASANAAGPGTSISDTVTVTGLPDGVTAAYTWRLLGPVAAINDSCVGVDWATAPELTNGALSFTGSGSQSTAPVTLSAVGCYTYTGHLASTPDSLEVSLDAGDPAETILISPTGTAVVTAISNTAATSGDVVHDTVTVSGLGSTATTYTWTLYGPKAPVGGACVGVDWAGADEVSGTIPITGDGTYTTPDVTVFDAGCYSYGGELAATATTTAASQAPGVPAETTQVTAATPGLSTQASPQNGQPGLVVHDTVTITGPVPAGTVYTWRLYGPIPAVNGSCAGLDWSDADFVSGTVTLTGPGVVTTDDVTLDEVGCYSYGGTLPATNGTAAVTQDPGVPAETVQVTANSPTVVTTASDATGLPGDTFSDSISITGTAGASTTYQWTLLGPVAAVNGSCATVDWTGAPQLDSGTITVNGDGVYSTPDRTVDEVGCYTYTGALAATATTDPVSLGAGDPAETFLIEAFGPEVQTTATGPLVSGGNAHDTVVITGSGGVTTSYDWALLTAPVDGAGTCVAVDWATATEVDHGTITINGDGTYTTPDVAITAAGCYTYTGLLAGTATSDEVTLAAGDPAETFLVALIEPTIATTASTASAQPGDTVTDTIVVTGGGLTGSTYLWQLLGPVAAINGSCDAVDWSGAATADSGSITVNAGAGTYQTTESTVGLPGCYTYAGELLATPSAAGAVHAPGHPAETFLALALDPAIVTHASTQAAHPGDTVADSIELTGTRGATPELTWRLLGPVPARGGSCDGLVWATADVVAEGTITTTGDGVYLTPDTRVDAIGCYTFEVTAAATPTTNVAISVAGDPDETLRLTARPSGLALTGGPGFTAMWVGGAGVLLGLALLIIMRLRRPRGRHAD